MLNGIDITTLAVVAVAYYLHKNHQLEKAKQEKEEKKND
jgi:hypothetical protein